MTSTTQQRGESATPDSKDKDFFRFHEYLKSYTATCTMAAVALGIYRPSACRYKRWLEKEGRLAEVKKSTCEITGFVAAYLTTDETKFPAKSQLNLF